MRRPRLGLPRPFACLPGGDTKGTDDLLCLRFTPGSDWQSLVGGFRAQLPRKERLATDQMKLALDGRAQHFQRFGHPDNALPPRSALYLNDYQWSANPRGMHNRNAAFPVNVARMTSIKLGWMKLVCVDREYLNLVPQL